MAKLKKNKAGYCSAWYNGKRFYGKTDAEAKGKRDEYKYNCEHGIENVEPIRVFDLVEQWLPVAKAGVAKRTYNSYVNIFERMTDTIGEKFVSAVTPNDIKNVWAQYVGLSDSMIKKAKFLYRSFFISAVENGYCRHNPMLAESAQPHKGSKGSHRALEQWEVDLIESTPHRCRAAAMFMLYSGLRRGEILSLTTNDIRKDYIYVTKAVYFSSNAPLEKDPKNESSIRKVPLFDQLKPIVDEIDFWVLPDEKGKQCSETAFRRAWQSYITALETEMNGCHKRWWHLTKEWKQDHPLEYARYEKLLKTDKEQAEAYRLKGWVPVSIRPHDLRHTFVSHCRDNGVDIHVCMEWCGHSSEKMILEIYDHPSAKRYSDSINSMNQNRYKTDNFGTSDDKNVGKSTLTG